jgi:tol-pal system protein YbgF
MSRFKLESLWRRGFRTAPFWFAAALLCTTTGCVATKKDVRMLQQELALSRARQDSLHRELQRQDRAMLDTLRRSNEFARDMQSRLTGQIREVKDLIEVLQQLMGQTQQRISEAREAVNRLQQQAPPPAPVTPAGTSGGGATADTLYNIGLQKYNDRSFSTARAAFEELLREFPTHVLAVDAQYYLAETYAQEGDAARAYQEFEKVVEMHPSHMRARVALFRAGAVAEEKRDRTKARQYYQRLVRDYPNTDEAQQAQARIRALRQ